MIWYLFIGYVILSQIIVFSWLGFSAVYCEDGNAFWEHGEDFSSARKALVLMIVGVLVFVSAAIVLPVMMIYLVRWWRDESKEAKELFRTYKGLILEPLHAANIPEDLLDYFEKHTTAPVAMGFDQLGDFWLKEEPFNSKARIFLHPRGKAFAEIGVTLDTLYCETTSFLEDGTVVSSANCNGFSRSKAFAKKGFHVNAIPNGDMREVIDEHMRFLEKVSDEKGVPVREITRTNWKAYFHYHNHHYGHVRYELDEIDAPPAKHEFPSAIQSGLDPTTACGC